MFDMNGHYRIKRILGDLCADSDYHVHSIVSYQLVIKPKYDWPGSELPSGMGLK